MATVAPDLPRSTFQLSPIKAMELAASKVPGVISLAQGIPSFATPAEIKDFVQQKIAEGACDKYSLTVGLSEFREEVALALQADGLRYDPEREIIACCGAAEGISAAVMACCEPGDEVILPNPSYPSYAGAIGMARSHIRYVPLDEDRNFDFHIDAIEKALTRRTRMILFCSPNNPTGTLFSEQATRAIVKLALERNIYLLIDEVYKDFYYTLDKHFSAASISEARDRVIRVCSLSKAYAMTGWRIGFVHSSAPTMQRVLKYHDAMVTCAPVVSQYAAIAALRYGHAALEQFKLEFKKRRDYCISRLDQLSDVLDYQVPKATYFVFPRIKDMHPLAKDSHRLAYDILERAKLALVPGVAFGPAGESHLRISFGKELGELEKGFDRLAEYFNHHDRKRLTLPIASYKQQRRQSVLKSALSWGLARAAALYLKRYRPTVIGICGSRGKTVFKRVIAERLAESSEVRAGVLSYNTQIGLPLSIFGLRAPTRLREFVASIFQIACRLTFMPHRDRILVLEYGVNSPADALALLNIARPDWLVVSAVSDNEPGTNYDQTLEGVLMLVRAVPKEHVYWSGNDSALAQLKDDFLADNELLPAISAAGSNLVGDSAFLALNAAERLKSSLMRA